MAVAGPQAVRPAATAECQQYSHQVVAAASNLDCYIISLCVYVCR